MSEVQSFPPFVEHMVNGRKEVAVFIPILPGRPITWMPRNIEDGVFEIYVSGGKRLKFRLPASSLHLAVTDGKILFIEVSLLDDEKYETIANMHGS